ncbi:MAG: sterol desaturase family protein [Dolichospermum sp. DET50]|jgi:sterol desaturase/sphingolipid hydroxylase (fatty acid hydroxylase superfamily)|nr:sterol desaturase family protein [Dolichospermum sp. DET73]MBS3029163.1 sterol desaturase family protein [Dolichospermum sp. DET66]MBS3034364.1 sterol desaturase family protein [Dolichospermum sp. DET67]MBS3039567.1 sterol desaturase family protein [Dolichospermum sp. DET50]QSX66780.1 MAG: sterol desaturase family protein [Dolichospermum sp. DET69]
MVTTLMGETLINLLLLCILLGICLVAEWTAHKWQQAILWLSTAGLLILLVTAIILHDWTRVGILVIGIFLESLWFRQSNHWTSKETLITLGINAFSGMITISLQAFLFAVLLKEFPSGTGHWGLVALSTPLTLQIVIYLILEDFKRYCFHRLDHSSVFFWRFHKIHHGVTELNCITGSRDHPVFNLGHLTSDIGLAYLLGVTNEALVIGLSIRMVFGGILPHFNVDFPNTKKTFPWWAYLIATPNFHAWHHTVHCRYDANLADVFPIWDVLFGTFEMPRGSSCDWQFGLNESEQIPQSVVGQLVSPFGTSNTIAPNNSI